LKHLGYGLATLGPHVSREKSLELPRQLDKTASRLVCSPIDYDQRAYAILFGNKCQDTFEIAIPITRLPAGCPLGQGEAALRQVSAIVRGHLRNSAIRSWALLTPISWARVDLSSQAIPSHRNPLRENCPSLSLDAMYRGSKTLD
jgi:hypothetical protein